MECIATLDYRNHPAFKDILIEYAYDDIYVETLVAEIDAAFNELSIISNVDALRMTFSNSVEMPLNKLSEYVKSRCPSIIAYEFFEASLKWATQELLKEALRNLLRNQYSRVECPVEFEKNINANGMHIVSFSDSIMQEMRAASKSYYDRLKKKAKEKPFERSYESVDMSDSLGIAIKKMVHATQILPTMSNYMRAEMEIMGVGIEYAYENQQWYTGCYEDVGMNHTKLSYMHFDEASYYPKTLCYITPVESAENGATRYIPGSHKWTRSEFKFLLHKGFDRVSSDRFYGLFDKYYRPMFKHVELRKMLLALPYGLVGTSHIGDDIIDGTPLSEELLKAEVAFLTKGCEAIVFDGGRGYHRGAMVQSGERLSLQIIYRAKNEAKIDMLSKNETPIDWMKRSYRTFRKALQNL